MVDGREIQAKIVFDTSGIGDVGAANPAEASQIKETAKNTSQSLGKISRFLLGGEVDQYMKGTVGLARALSPAGVLAVGLTALAGKVVGGGVEAGLTGAVRGVGTSDEMEKREEIEEAIDENKVSTEDLTDSYDIMRNSIDRNDQATERLSNSINEFDGDLKPVIGSTFEFGSSLISAIRSLKLFADTADSAINGLNQARESLANNFGTSISPVRLDRTNDFLNLEQNLPTQKTLDIKSPQLPASTRQLSIINASLSKSRGSTTTSQYEK